MSGGADAFSDDDSDRRITDINVTPLVDITLVLLIIFMVTTTYIVNPTIKVDLPKAASGSEQMRTTLALTLSKEGGLYLNGEKSDEGAVTRFIGDELPKNPDLQAIIAADRIVPHGNVVRVIDIVKRAGVRKFAINVESPAALGSTPAPVDPSAPAAPTDPSAPAGSAAPGAPPGEPAAPGGGAAPPARPNER
jgi:biopolymer transport protein ExbD